jgi:hypothetical protein
LLLTGGCYSIVVVSSGSTVFQKCTAIRKTHILTNYYREIRRN